MDNIKEKTRPVEVDRFDVDPLESHFLAVVVSRLDKLLPPPILAAQTVHGGPVCRVRGCFEGQTVKQELISSWILFKTVRS